MIKNKLRILENKLIVTLDEIRASHHHKGNRGSGAESAFRKLLQEYLPPENRVGEGEIIDTGEQISTQIDVVITNEYHPYINDLKEPGLFIIEGVACAGEVKSNLNTTDLDTLLENCIKYKKLKPKIQHGAEVFGNISDITRFVEHRPYFIFAYQSQLTIETIHKKMNSFYEQNGTPIERQIDGVFCLDRGSIINFGDGKGSLQYSTKEGASVPGLIITKLGGQGVLSDLLMWLSISIPKYKLHISPLVHYLLEG